MSLLTTPFLTEIDSRAEVKGSRDPIGAQSVWTHLGRRVVRNLTTVSTSLRDFTITILGYYFTEQAAEDLGAGSELATFLKWEQLAGYARFHVRKETGFRGRDKVRDNLKTSKTIPISEDRAAQILSNQKIYGLWGLYTSPARVSSLLEGGDPTRLSAPARELVEKVYLPRLTKHGFKNGRAVLDVLKNKRSRIEPDGSSADLLKAIASLLVPELTPLERATYRHHLVHGGPAKTIDDQLQQLMAALLPSTFGPNFVWTRSAIRSLRTKAETLGGAGALLARRLERIEICESVLAPSALLFGRLLSLDGQEVTAVAESLRGQWGTRVASIDPVAFRTLETELCEINEEVGRRWLQVADAFATGAYEDLVTLLAQQNRTIMADRGAGAAWLDVRQGRLSVRFRDEETRLPQRKDLPELWRFPYFLDSLRTMTKAVEAAPDAR